VNRSLSSTYSIDWLRRFRNDDASMAQKRWTSEVRPIHAVRSDGLPHGDNGLIRLDYSSIVGGEGVFALLDAVFRDGAAIVYGAPAPSVISEDTDYPVAKVAMAVTSGSRLSHGALYGDVFHVREGERGAINAAYTSDGLRMHQDLAYYESPPGLQLLHCVENGSGVLGGESILIDGMAAAHRFREVRPVSFETLVRCSATFVKQRDSACMTYRRPHIVLADDNDDESDKYNIDRQIVAVHWSPPFEGPVYLPPRQVDRYHKAHADFDRMINGDNDDKDDKDRAIENDLAQYAKEYTWERKLLPGEILVFNNRRMFHGRRAFSSLEGSSANDCRRHLVGCYTNIDDTLNLYRVLMRERGYASTTILNPGNGTSLIP
jgi:alpha-ketoglutarate-dependent taurine dioxygenase